jgi:hypothetical protein
VHNEGGSKRVLVTKNLPGSRWLDVLIAANCRVEVCTSEETILDIHTIQKLIGDKCDGVIGQLTEAWGTLLTLTPHSHVATDKFQTTHAKLRVCYCGGSQREQELHQAA